MELVPVRLRGLVVPLGLFGGIALTYNSYLRKQLADAQQQQHRPVVDNSTDDVDHEPNVFAGDFSHQERGDGFTFTSGGGAGGGGQGNHSGNTSSSSRYGDPDLDRRQTMSTSHVNRPDT